MTTAAWTAKRTNSSHKIDQICAGYSIYTDGFRAFFISADGRDCPRMALIAITSAHSAEIQAGMVPNSGGNTLIYGSRKQQTLSRRKSLTGGRIRVRAAFSRSRRGNTTEFSEDTPNFRSFSTSGDSPTTVKVSSTAP